MDSRVGSAILTGRSATHGHANAQANHKTAGDALLPEPNLVASGATRQEYRTRARMRA